MMIARISKIIMALCLGLFALLCASDNVGDYGVNFIFVRHVLSMDTVHDPVVTGRAIMAPALWHLFYWLIIVGEAATGFLFAAGSYEMWKSRQAAAALFQAAKRWALAATLMGFLVWFFGFMVIGGEWFQTWQSAWNGQEGGFRVYMTMLAVMIFI